MECMCRVCETIYDLRNMFEEENEELLLMLRSVADITITVDDLLPKYLCSTCSRRLQRAYDFKLQCELTDQKLRETLEPDKPSSPYKEQDSKEQHENNLEELLYKRLYEKTVKGEAAAQPSSEDYGTTFNYVISEVKGEKAPVPNAASVEIPNLIVNPPISIDTKEIPIPNEKTVIFVEDSKKMDIGMKFEVVEESTCFEDIIEEDYTEEPMVAEPVEQKMVEVREIAVVIPEAIDPPKEEPKTEPQEIFSELSVEKKEEEATQEPTPSVSAITFEDPLPKHICGICARKLCQSYEFIKQCENTDQKLRRHCDADALRKGRAASGVFGLHCNQYEERDAAAQWEIIYNGEDSYGDLNSHDEEHSSDLNLIDCIYQGYAEADDVIVVKDELSMDAQELDAVDENPEFLEEDNSESSTKDSAGYFSTKPSPNDETVVPVAQADENTAEDCVLSNQDGSFDDFIVEEVEQSENDEQNENDDERTRSPAALQYANLKTKPPKIFKCNSCSATFTNFRELNTHKKSHGEKRFECPTCLKRFSRHYRMREHLQTHTNPRKLPCPLCNNTYTNRGNLDRHVRHCHNKEKTHACEYCGMSFARKATLKVHFATHSDARDFECGKCGKKFKTAYYLNVHQKSHIPMELRLNKRPKQKRKSQTCICHCCGKTSRTLSLHINHMRTHSGERPFECPTCLKRFTFKQTLKTHMLLHSGEKPYICDICNMAFRQVAHLNGHKVALHTGLKQHKCQFCDKSFALRSNLTIHARLHTGDKPHQCTICGKRFNDTNGLKRHRISHTRNGLVETPTQCEKAQMKAASRKEEDASELNKLDVGLDQLNVYLDELGNEYTEIIETETILEAAT